MYIFLTAVVTVKLYQSFKTLFAFTLQNRKERKGKERENKFLCGLNVIGSNIFYQK